VVDPLFFPGGDIGRLAVNGTVNDLAVGGATPLYLSAGFVLEEGFPLEDLQRIVHSMAQAARSADIWVVTGDTKVVNRGGVDKVFINTSGIGIVPEGVELGPHRIRPGDRILLSGDLGDHGMAVLAQREGLAFDTPVESDTAPLHGLVQAMLAATRRIHCMRDPTRGGLATALNEIARQAGVGVVLEEDRLPVKDAVRGLCEILGLDPLYLANEGRLLAFVPAEAAETVLAAMQAHPLGQGAAMVGEAVAQHPGQVVLRTCVGGNRIVEMLSGDPLPRIC